MRRFFVHIFLIFCLAPAIPALAQQYNIKLYGTRDGLVNSIVKTIFLDSRGYLWFGTQGGVSRFDGRQFRNFTEKDGLPGNDITCITEDRQGNIWIGTYGFGISKYDGQKFTNYGEKEGLGNNKVYSIVCDEQQNIWSTTFGGGISRYDGKKFQSYSTKTGLLTDQFLKCAAARADNMWFCTRGKGVYRYDGKNFINYGLNDGLNSSSYYSVLPDSKGNVWLGSISKGIDIIAPDFSIKHLDSPEIDGDLISAIIEDKRGNYWIAAKKGLLKYNNRQQMLFTDKHGLPSNSIYSICEDYEGNIWVGTAAGICMFRNEAMVAYTDKEGIAKKNVTAFFKDSRNHQFVGMYGGGAGILENNVVTPLDQIKELNGQIVLAFHEDQQNRIWVGCDVNENGLVILKKENDRWITDRTHREFGKQLLKTVTRIISDRKGNTWLASYGSGVFCIHPDNSFTLYNDSTGFPTNDILTIYEDRAGNIWAGSLQHGLIKIDTNGKISFITEKEGLGDNSVWAITEDSKGRLFFGTNDNGLSCYDGKKFHTISTSNGLSSDLVYALITDAQDRLWVGTDKGMNRLSLGKNLEVNSLKFYGEKEGLIGTEINQHSFFFDREGILWVGTTNGLMRYDARYDYVNDNPPRIQLNNIRLFYQDVDWSKYADSLDPRTNLPIKPVLSYRDNNLTFDFQALTTDNVSYQFMLEGLDNDWTPLTANISAAYTNIPSGHTYTFKVKAVNSDGFWSKEITSYTFTIRPPFWQTWWFYTICIVIAILGVVSFIRWRTGRLEHEKRVLEDKVNERTQELQVANLHLSAAYTDIRDSINYAKRIQQAILPPETEVGKMLPEHFIFFRPRDVVSGDFYWFFQKGDRTYAAAIDCTGHGVPGAFMSIIGNALLNEIMNETNLVRPADIMSHLRERLIHALRQTGHEGESKDGMDMVLCCIDRSNNTVSFAGANNPLYHFTGGQMYEYKGDKYPIGIHGDELKPFTHQEIQVSSNDVIYIFSDGYPDQFGGLRGKKFLYTQFKQLLQRIHPERLSDQKTEVEKAFDEWKGENFQVDDVLVIGIRI
ncbi:MAG: serine phosphatase RsbU, regulator of sigma subunit [Bacteroidetes bacterium]|nr:MAG: serine phosphatase RsbU, regulator of sigma subunit [Bacteroidota bacterium]